MRLGVALALVTAQLTHVENAPTAYNSPAFLGDINSAGPPMSNHGGPVCALSSPDSAMTSVADWAVAARANKRIRAGRAALVAAAPGASTERPMPTCEPAELPQLACEPAEQLDLTQAALFEPLSATMPAERLGKKQRRGAEPVDEATPLRPGRKSARMPAAITFAHGPQCGPNCGHVTPPTPKSALAAEKMMADMVAKQADLVIATHGGQLFGWDEFRTELLGLGGLGSRRRRGQATSGLTARHGA